MQDPTATPVYKYLYTKEEHEYQSLEENEKLIPGKSCDCQSH
jgi:hypothetical protein